MSCIPAYKIILQIVLKFWLKIISNDQDYLRSKNKFVTLSCQTSLPIKINYFHVL